ncbi:MAG TPA: arsenate reductase (glutaredoxin) [Candidatus Binataceae bacterium]|nr:arsenate reductase (glutaredoxin) [Candidatus Binataceae bacterium]
MARVTIFHNPACGNSRGAMELLRERGVEFDTVLYLKNPPNRETLERIVAALDGPVADLVRKDKRFEELGLKAPDYVEPKKIIDLLLKHPELMQRPIVVSGKRAIIARPPDKLTALL